MRMASDFNVACGIVEKGKTIVFSSKQAEIFDEKTSRFIDDLDYRLPFQETILQFDEPLSAKYPLRRNMGISDHVSALLLRQVQLTKKEVEEEYKFWQDEMNRLHITDSDMTFQSFHFDSDEVIQNALCVVFSDNYVIRYGWQSGTTHEQAYIRDDVPDDYADKSGVELTHYRNLAIACIGYINCENIYLHREDVPDKVNRKREAKGKSKLEPYYVCRIRGVNYDSAGATGEGSKHGIRYDVRGHFRRLTSGKTTWVRPHQRGLSNELYVPKTYVVDKRPEAA